MGRDDNTPVLLPSRNFLSHSSIGAILGSDRITAINYMRVKTIASKLGVNLTVDEISSLLVKLSPMKRVLGDDEVLTLVYYALLKRGDPMAFRILALLCPDKGSCRHGFRQVMRLLGRPRITDIVKALPLDRDVKRKAVEIANDMERLGLHTGRKLSTVIAYILFKAGVDFNEVRRLTNVTYNTLRSFEKSVKSRLG